MEKIRYCIFTIGDARAWNVANIEAHCNNMERIPVHTVDGRFEAREWIQKLGVTVITERHPAGEIGVFLSVLNALEHALEEPLLTIEDDALVNPNFEANLRYFIDKLPADTDFFSLFLPRDHCDANFYQGVLIDEWGNVKGNEPSWYDGGHDAWKTDDPEIFRAYQRYGGVSMYYTPQGAEKILKLVREKGIYDQYDNFLYACSKIGLLNGYTTHPKATELLAIVGGLPSTTHSTEIFIP
jgi:hypothetical protein